MKKIIYTAIFLVFTNFTFAQSFKTETSDAFDSNIGVPVLLMKDGSTVFQYDDIKERKMLITIFDKDHKIVINKKAVDFKKVNYVYHFSYQQSSHVSFWAESNGKAKIYMESDLKPYYVIINVKTGSVEDEIEIQNVGTVNTTYYNSKAIEHKYIQKYQIDPITGNRLKVNKTWKQLKKEEALSRTDFSDISTVDFTIFNSDGKEIKKIPFDFADKKYQAIRFLHTVFYNDIIYFVSKMYKVTDRATYDGPNTGKGAVGVVCFSEYDLTTQKFTHKELFDIKDDINYDNCTIIQNYDKSIFNLKFTVKTGNSNGNLVKDAQVFYSIFFQPIDPKTFKLEKPYYLPSEKLDAFVKTNCKIKDGYVGGMLDRCLIDKKGNILTTKVKNVIGFASGYADTQNPELIGISYFDKTGNEINAWAFPYNTTGTIEPFSSSGKIEVNVKSGFNFLIGTGSKNNIIFLNNLSKNYNFPLDQKPEVAKSLDDCNAMAIELTNEGIKQYYVFGEPANKKSNKYVDFANALYDEKSNTVIVKVFDGPGYENTHAAWIKVE
ncbi:MAG: hypothetical protein A3F72_02110 [Bacteroidetes bacterium RIFCSPLOWO2_12_FULL_35_15]|nr:MAG: hypothetical protein A3F72_02110 [Bacteroidetes bacterium RIFCSPLOWO2_12_FULL_35_15]